MTSALEKKLPSVPRDKNLSFQLEFFLEKSKAILQLLTISCQAQDAALRSTEITLHAELAVEILLFEAESFNRQKLQI